MKKTSISEKNNNYSTKSILSNDLYFIRGIAISLVVLGHVIGGRNEGIRQLYEQDILYMDWLYKFIYTFHMPAFFILSGISFKVFSSNNNSYVKFINSRLTRIVIPLIFWGSIYFILRSLSGAVNFYFIGLIKSLIYPNFIFWFFHALLFATVLGFFLINKLGYPKVYYASSIIIFLLSFYLKGSLSVFCYFNIFYAFGIAIATHMAIIRSMLENLSHILTFLCVLFLIFIMIVTYHFLGNDYSLVAKFVNGIIGFTLMYMLAIWNRSVSVFELLNRFSKSMADIFIHLGVISMSIYLLHIIFGSATRTILVKLGILDPLTQFVIGYANSIIGLLLIHNLLHEKSKFFRYSIGESK